MLLVFFFCSCLRCVQNARLIDCVPQNLKSVTDYQLAASVYLATPLAEYLTEHCIPIPGDWPSQFYQRQMSYANALLTAGLQNTVASMGPLHVSLNAQENVVMKFMPFFARFYNSIFHKQLAKKPKPWRISLLLEVLYGGWTLIRQPVLQRLGRSKDLQIRTLLNLLENYTPLVLSIYSVLFKSNCYAGYYLAMQQVWVMFWSFRRRHYDKSPLVWLSNMLYLARIEHPLYNTIRQNLNILDEYPVENFHSLLRARTEPWDDGQAVQRKAVWIDERRHELHEFATWFVPPRQCQLRRSQLRNLKAQAANYLLSTLNEICTHPFSAEQLPRIGGQAAGVTRWRLPHVFGATPAKNVVLPLGFQFEGNKDLQRALHPPGLGQQPPFTPDQERRCDRTGCPTHGAGDDVVVLFPCGHSFHRSCVTPIIDVCFICRLGLTLAVEEKAEVARRAIFHPDANAGQQHDGGDENDEEDDDDDPLHVAELTEEQAGATLQGLLQQAAALPIIPLL